MICFEKTIDSYLSDAKCIFNINPTEINAEIVALNL